LIRSISAAVSPAGPAPMIPTDWLDRSATMRTGLTQPISHAVSVMNFSTLPIVTAPNPGSITQLPSHNLSCGQMRPQISGIDEVADDASYASSSRPSAVSRSQSGMLLWSGQWTWQNGTPHCEQRDACSSALARMYGRAISRKSSARSCAPRFAG
jgi:hypothetical protein